MMFVRELSNLGALMLAALAASSIAAADETPRAPIRDYSAIGLDELLDVGVDVSSTKPQQIFGTPSTVTVIDRQFIDAHGITSVSEALATVPGMSILRTYLKRELPTVRGILQDHYANKVLVMINGVPSWHAVTGEGNIDRVHIDDIERIEVLRGPGSVLHGTNAYAGAINLVLRNRAESGGGVDMRLGSGRTFEGGGNGTYRAGDLGLFLGAHSDDQRGQEEYFVDEHGVAGWIPQYLRKSSFSARASYRQHAAFLNAYAVHEDHFGVTPNFSAGAGKDHRVSGYLANYTFTHAWENRFEVRTGASFDWNHRSFSRSASDAERSNVKGYRAQAFARGTARIADFLDLEVGGDFDYRVARRYTNTDVLHHAVLTYNNIDDRHVSEYSVYGQGNLSVGDLSVVLGARYTGNELFDSNVAYRGSAVYALGRRSSLKLVAGQSYRAPTLFELYFQTPSNTVYGNPNLEPERSSSVELAYLFAWQDLFFQALGYYAAYDNKIFRVRRDPTSTTDFSTAYVNGERFRGHGAEVEARYHKADVASAFVSYAYTAGDKGDRIVVTDHYNFKYVPAHTVSGGVALIWHAADLGATAHWVSARQGPFETIEAQTTLDLHLTYAHGPMRHGLYAKNVLDEDVRVPEYVRLNTINDLPQGDRRFVFYRFEYEY